MAEFVMSFDEMYEKFKPIFGTQKLYVISNDNEIKIQPPKQKKERAEACGLLKGLVNLPDDFNKPLECFEDYME
ncbi:MAG: DUF2281 domain-containing protein [Oscillospiraceae bacterium]|jgi:hypothetical protein|nr:DUF2281 domain-containing protein [Oscillospiraceae bacterium]